MYKLFSILLSKLYIILYIFLFSSPAFSFSWQQTELHHIFPKKYKKWFAQRGIDIDVYCIPLSRKNHTGAGTISIHYKKYTITGKNFNQSWKFFIKNNSSATQKECFSFITYLLGEFGIKANNNSFIIIKQKKFLWQKFLTKISLIVYIPIFYFFFFAVVRNFRKSSISSIAIQTNVLFSRNYLFSPTGI